MSVSVFYKLLLASPVDDALRGLEVRRTPHTRGAPQKIIVVVPVYRELYSGNLARNLQSLLRAAQAAQGRGMSFHVLYLVNNSINVTRAVRLENQRAVAFLRPLSLRTVPAESLAEENPYLFKVAQECNQSQALQVHCLNLTSPGYRFHRNIGFLRDWGLRHALKHLISPKEDPFRVILAQMDADVTVSSTYFLSISEAMQRLRAQFGLLGLSLQLEPQSQPELVERYGVEQLRLAVYDFIHALDGGLPVSGTPRIVARASAMNKVGGVPYWEYGEDRELIRRLHKAYPEGGVYIGSEGVRANFRARKDGYDASLYLEQLTQPLNSDPHITAKETVSGLEQSVVNYLEFELKAYREGVLRLYLRERDWLIKERLQELYDARQFLREWLLRGDKEPLEPSTPLKVSRDLLVFFELDWFRSRARMLFKHFKKEFHYEGLALADAVLAELTSQFPDLLGVPLSQVALRQLRFIALSRALRWEQDAERDGHEVEAQDRILEEVLGRPSADERLRLSTPGAPCSSILESMRS